MFFFRTEESVITREELLSKERGHTEYFTSIVYDDENGKQEFVSGVRIIQEKWNPSALYIDADIDAADVAGSIMAEVNKLVEAPEDLAVLHKIIEQTIAHCETKPYEAELAEFTGENSITKQHMVDPVRESLRKLYQQEYYSLIRNGSICSTVTVIPEPVIDEHGYIELGSEAYTSVKLVVTPRLKLKEQAEREIFDKFKYRPRQVVKAVFQLKILTSPEAMAIAKLKEYFFAMAELLQAKTVFESDFRPNPFNAMGEPVYFPHKIRARLGTGLVEEVQAFCWSLKENRFFEALCALERVQRLQEEICKITDQRVKEMTIETLNVLNQNWDTLKTYFDNWDTYIGNIICSDQGIDAYIENINLADYL